MKRPSAWCPRTYEQLTRTNYYKLFRLSTDTTGPALALARQVESSAKRLAGYSCLSAAAQHFLYFWPLPHGQGAFGLGFFLPVGLVNAWRGSLRMTSSTRRRASVALVCP